MQKFRVMPPTGYPVQWYPSGDRSNPVPAVMQKIEGAGSGMATVTVTAMGVSMYGHRHYVLHVDAPEINQKDPSWVQKYGTWDYIPGMQRVGEISPAQWERAKSAKAAEQVAVEKQPQQQQIDPSKTGKPVAAAKYCEPS